MEALTLMGLLWIGVTVVTAVYFITEPASARKLNQTGEDNEKRKHTFPASSARPGEKINKRVNYRLFHTGIN